MSWFGVDIYFMVSPHDGRSLILVNGALVPHVAPELAVRRKKRLLANDNHRKLAIEL